MILTEKTKRSRLFLTRLAYDEHKTDIKDIFLGPWCVSGDIWNEYQRSEIQVLDYHWDDRELAHSDALRLFKLHHGIIEKLAAYLNDVHDVSFSVRFWDILVGQWLIYFVPIVYDRYRCVQTAFNHLQKEEVDVVWLYKQECLDSQSSWDFLDFQSRFSSDYWNQILLQDIIEELEIAVHKHPFETTSKDFDTSRIKQFTEQTCGATKRLSFATLVIKGLEFLTPYFKKYCRYFFYGERLSPKELFFIQLSLRQLPFFWTTPESIKFISAERQKSGLNIELSDDLGFEKEFLSLVSQLIIEYIPFAYLEGFKGLYDSLTRAGWPVRKHGLYIHTSTAYATDEAFKLFAASCVDKGSKYYISQHGGGYGSTKWQIDEQHQISIADQFLAWGDWGKANDLATMGFDNAKIFSKLTPDVSGDLLLPILTQPRYFYRALSNPLGSIQYFNSLESLCRLLNLLPEPIQSKSKLRLQVPNNYLSREEAFLKKYAKVGIEDAVESIFDRLAKSRLCLCHYHSTTLLETLYSNFPTIIFLDLRYFEIRTESEPFFRALANVGIFHTEAEQCAEFIGKVWDDIDGWWYLNDTQHAVKRFCDEYASSDSFSFVNFLKA